MTRKRRLLLTVLVTLLFGALFAVSPGAAQSLDFNDQDVGQDDEVLVENVVTDGDPTAILVTYPGQTSNIVAGVAPPQQVSDGAVTVSIGDTGGLPGQHTAHIIPAADASKEYVPGDTLSQSTLSGVTDSETALLTGDSSSSQPSLLNLNIANQGETANIPQGSDENVSLVVENAGTEISSFDVTLGIGSAVNQTKSTGPISADGSAILSFDGVTGGLAPGSYDVEVTATGELLRGNLTVEPEQTVNQRLNFSDQQLTETNEVVFENVETDGVTAQLLVTYQNASGDVVAGLNGGVFSGEDVPVRVLDTSAVPGEYTAHILPIEDASKPYQPGDLLSTETAANIADSETATISEEGQGPSLALEFDEQGIDNGAVTVENVTTGGVEAAVVVTYEQLGLGQTGRAVAGQTVGTFDGENVQVALNDTSGLGENHTAHILPADKLSTGTETGGALSETTADAVAASTEAYVSVEFIDGQPARDTTGNGLLNDVRGDGNFNILDVQSLFNNLERPDVQNNPNLFGFFDASDGMDILDVQGLFNRLP